MNNTDAIVFPASEAATVAIHQIDNMRSGRRRGIPIGIKEIDELMVPWLPGYFVPICGRPGSGKSSLMLYHANWWANELNALNEESGENEVAVVVSWEQAVESLVIYDLAAKSGIPMSKIARGDLNDMEYEEVKGAGIWHGPKPLFYIGFSDSIQAKRPPMTIETVHRALEMIRDWSCKNSFKISIIYLDYIQRVTPSHAHESKAVATGAVVDEMKELALSWSVPVLAGCQAKPECDKRGGERNPGEKIPGAEDGEWTNNAGKAADCFVSVMRPSLYGKDGDVIDAMTVKGYKQMAIRICKQKMGPAPFTQWVDFDVATCRLLASYKSRSLND